MVAGLKNAPLFSPDPTAADEAPTPRLHGSSLMPEALAPSSPISLPADSSGGGSEAAAGPSAPRAALGPTNSLWAFFVRELQWGHSLSWRQRGMPTEHVMNFFRVTVALEPFLTFGHLLCIDLFLFHFTALPLRCAGALWRLGCMAAASLLRRVGLLGSAQGAPPSGSAAGFTQAQAYDLIKGAIFLAATLALGAVQVSRVYHYIRGEAIIKLYVIFNILEIFDKLACSLGQDVMDGLYRTTRDRPISVSGRTWDAWRPLALHFCIAVVYVVSHAVILFVQIVCLNVAMNSRNNALFTLLISNNFMELKSSVFKRFEAENLFQVACADAVERFQLVLFLVLICVQELTSLAAARALLPSILAIFACEVLVDYVKHAFISKFNRLHSDLYGTFRTILANDLLAVRARMGSSLDPTHSAVKRLGLATLPLAVVAHRMLLLRFWPDVAPARGGGEAAASGGLDSDLGGPGDVLDAAAAALEGGSAAAGAMAGSAAAASDSVKAVGSFLYGLMPTLDALPSARAAALGAVIMLCLLALKTALSMALLASAARTVLAHKRSRVASSGEPVALVAAPPAPAGGGEGSARPTTARKRPGSARTAASTPAAAAAAAAGPPPRTSASASESRSPDTAAGAAGAGALQCAQELVEGKDGWEEREEEEGGGEGSDAESVDSAASGPGPAPPAERKGAASAAAGPFEAGSANEHELVSRLANTRRYDISRNRIPL